MNTIQWVKNYFENSEINPLIDGLLARVPRPFVGKGQSFSRLYWENWIATCERVKLDPHHIAYININLKWIKDKKGRTKTIKLLGKNIGKSFKTLDLTMISWLWHQSHSQQGKNRLIGLHENLNTLYIKGHNQQSEKLTQGMEKKNL